MFGEISALSFYFRSLIDVLNDVKKISYFHLIAMYLWLIWVTIRLSPPFFQVESSIQMFYRQNTSVS